MPNVHFEAPLSMYSFETGLTMLGTYYPETRMFLIQKCTGPRPGSAVLGNLTRQAAQLGMAHGQMHRHHRFVDARALSWDTWPQLIRHHLWLWESKYLQLNITSTTTSRSI